MNLVSGASGHPFAGNSTLAALFGALFLLAGCAGGAGHGSATLAGAPAAPTPPQDPLSQFLAGAAPGQSGRVTLADGRTTEVQVLRAYAAASGRECREVAMGGGRASLLCQADGQWVPARPLLPGGGAARP